MTEDENLKNMRSCPRFDYCSVPKCSLDYWADLRVELAEDEVCPMWRFAGQIKSKRMKTKIIPSLRDKVRFVRELKASSDKNSEIAPTTEHLTRSLGKVE